MNKLLMFSVLTVLLVGSLFFILQDKDETEYKLNTCQPKVYPKDSINNIVERYENKNCFEGYELFLEVKE